MKKKSSELGDCSEIETSEFRGLVLFSGGAWHVLAPGPGDRPRYLNRISRLEGDGCEGRRRKIYSGSTVVCRLVDEATLSDRRSQSTVCESYLHCRGLR